MEGLLSTGLTPSSLISITRKLQHFVLCKETAKNITLPASQNSFGFGMLFLRICATIRNCWEIKCPRMRFLKFIYLPDPVYPGLFYNHLRDSFINWLSHPLVQISSEHCLSQTGRARELKFWENVHPTLCVMCHVSCVMCHVSRVTCHVSPVTCHMSKYFFFVIFFIILLFFFI